jgi:RNA polymerase sigma factor (sigma-70 family)
VDEAAEQFKECYARYYGHLMRYAARRVGADQAEDVVAEAFTVVWQHMDKLGHGDPLPWLYGITRRVIGNHGRSHVRRERLATRVDAMTTVRNEDDHADDVLQRLDFESVMSALSSRDQEVLRLAEWEQLSVADAAIVLGCSSVAFKVRLHRARRRLAAALRNVDGIEGMVVRQAPATNKGERVL